MILTIISLMTMWRLQGIVFTCLLSIIDRVLDWINIRMKEKEIDKKNEKKIFLLKKASNLKDILGASVALLLFFDIEKNNNMLIALIIILMVIECTLDLICWFVEKREGVKLIYKNIFYL